MTKEELEKEAKEYAYWFWGASPSMMKALAEAYIKGAEPREKQIQIDAEQIRALQKQNGELTDELTKKSDTNHQLVEQLAKLNERCSELETQIKQMKCCEICANSKDWRNRSLCIACEKSKSHINFVLRR